MPNRVKRHGKVHWGLPVVGALVVGVVAGLLFVKSAAALPYGTSDSVGYFSGNYYGSGHNVLQGGAYVGDVGSLIGLLQGKYASPVNNDHTSAAFIVNTMLGRSFGDPAKNRSISAADWAELTARMNASNINWDEGYTFCTNSMFQDIDDDAFYDSPIGCLGPSSLDEDKFPVGNSIVFRDSAGNVTYALRKFCGNPVGDNPGLPVPAVPNVQLNASGNMTDVHVGDMPIVSFNLHNAGSGPSGNGVTQIMVPPGGAVSTAAGTWGQAVSGGFIPPSPGFRSPPPDYIPGATGPNWYWDNFGIGPGGTLFGALQFTVTAAAVPGTDINMEVYYVGWGGPASEVRHVTVTFHVVSLRTPNISATNSDVHAGDCASAIGGSVSGSGGSVGQYVVAANGGIGGFTSNTGNTKLNLGAGGGYTRLCRTNLYAAAWADYGGSSQVIPGSTFDVTGKSGVWYYTNTGTPLTLTGSAGVNGLLTVVSAGSVRIGAGVVASGVAVADPHDIPSLGVIANGNISILPNVTNVSAYLFANGTIFTCEGAVTGSASPACNNELTLSGFLMAGAIQFGRGGITNTNGSPNTEKISMNPAIYLNPPRYFDASVDNINLEGQGERAPLF